MFKVPVSRNSLIFEMKGKLRAFVPIVIISAGILFYFYYGIYKMLWVHVDLIGGDFIKGYCAATNFLNNRSIYDMPSWWHLYSGNPVTFLFMPFSTMPPAAAKMLWFAFCHVLAGVSFLVIYRYGSRNNSRVSLVSACAVMLFSMPLYGMFLTGNIVILIFFGLSLVYAGLISGRRHPLLFLQPSNYVLLL